MPSLSVARVLGAVVPSAKEVPVTGVTVNSAPERSSAPESAAPESTFWTKNVVLVSESVTVAVASSKPQTARAASVVFSFTLTAPFASTSR